MKEFRLSTQAERIASISFSAAIIAAFGILLYALRSQLWLMILCGLFVLLISAMLVIYVINVLKSVCIVDTQNKTIEVRGIANFTADISKAVLLQTIGKKNSQTSVRVLVFTDEEMEIVAKVPTMFTFKQGILAEPMAKEMAKELGIEFKENVPVWEYDKEAYKQHQKEEAEREKREAKERRKARFAWRIKKYKK
jgi:hypothetical protein